MRSFYKIVFFLSFIAGNTWSQNSIEGKVLDANTLEPLIGATVYFPDLKVGGASDLDGLYLVEFIPAGRLLIQVEYVGYSSVIQTVEVNGKTTYDFKLKPSITELHEIVITGLSAASEAAKDPIAHDFVNSNMLKKRVSTNVVDVIADQPGISQITSGPAVSKPVIRGLGYNRVVTLNNGQPQDGQQWGDEHGIEIDGTSVDRVEIIKGPGSLMYGSDAMAGVINFLQPKPLSQGEVKGRFATNYQSNSNLLGASLFNAGNIDGYGWQLNVSGKRSGNFRNSEDGRIFNSAFNEFNFNGYLGINRTWGFSHFNFSRFNQWLGLVEGERDAQGNFLKQELINGNVMEVTASEEDLSGFTIFLPKQNVNHLSLSSSNSIFLSGNSRISFSLGYQQNKRREFEELESTEPGLYFDLKTGNYDIKYFQQTESDWELTTGLNGKYQANRNLGEEVLIPEYNLFDFGIFGILKRSFDKLNLTGGLRYDLRTLDSQPLFYDTVGNPVSMAQASTSKFEALSRRFSNYSGSIGLTYSTSDKTLLKVNISRGFRAPNIAELSSNGVHEGTLRYEIGNPDMVPETSYQLDIGMHYHSEHVTAEVAIFNNYIDNYIFIEKLSGTGGGDSIPDPADPVPAFIFSQSRANLTGGEVLIDIHPHPVDWLHFENSFSIVNAVQLGETSKNDSTRYLPFTPAPVFRSTLKANHSGENRSFQNLFAEIGVSYTLEQDRVFSAFGTETPTDDYILVNIAAGMDLVNGGGRTFMSLTISAENLMNATYQSHLNRLKYAPVNPKTGRMGIYNMGRNISFKVEIPLNFRS